MRKSIVRRSRILCLGLVLLGSATPTVLVAHSVCDEPFVTVHPVASKSSCDVATPDSASALEPEDQSDFSPITSPTESTNVRSSQTISETMNAYGRLPLSFEANQGQTDARVRFLSRNNSYNLFLTADEAVLSMQIGAAGRVLRMKLLCASRCSRASGVAQLPGKSNYFLGSDQKNWRRNVSTYGKVKYEAIYPGIDLLYYGNQRQLEYDFIVSPGADPNRINLGFSGASGIRIDEKGDLVLRLASEEIRQLAPNAYQETDGVRRTVACRYAVHNNRVRFELGTYDHSSTLVIDPLLNYSTYLGGASAEAGYSIAVGTERDGAYAYITGLTRSVDFPTTAGAYQRTYVGIQNDVFITKLNQDGTRLVYSTYVGGGNNDIGYSIAVDGAGQAFVAGATESTNFPTTPGAYQQTRQGGRSAFLLKLLPAGDSLAFSTYLGGQVDQEAYGVALNGSNAYVAGWTASSNFPTTPGAYQPSCSSSTNCDNGFVAKFDASGGSLVYSTYLGIFSYTRIKGIAVDSAGGAYVAGFTGPGYQSQDGFVTRLSPAGDSSVYTHLLGGDDIDTCNAIAVDSSGNAYVTGETRSINYPSTFGEHIFGAGLGYNVFVTKLDPQGGVVYSRFLEGNSDDRGNGIAVDADGGAYVTGSTNSANFPVTADALQTYFEGGPADAFVTKLAASGATREYSTYWGGAADDSGNSIALDSVNHVYATGITYSSDLPATTGALRSSFGGSSDAFVLEIGMGQESLGISGQVTNNLNNPLSGVAVSVSGPFNRTVHTDTAGNYSIGGLVPGGQFTVSAQRGSFVFSPANVEFPSLAQNETLNFSGPAPLTISGTIRDSVGNTVYTSVSISGGATATVQTDDNGRYVFNELAQGLDYTVTPISSVYTFTPPSASVTALSGDSALDFVAQFSPTISGQVTDEYDYGVYATVALSGSYSTSTQTDADGNYYFASLQGGGNYTVTPSAANYGFTPPSQTFANLQSNQTANFAGTRLTFTISGRVTDSGGGALAGANVSLSGAQSSSTQTDAQGNYSFAALIAGNNYTVTPSSAHYFFSPASANVNNLSANSTVNFAATLLTHSITGRVVDGGGAGLAGVSVSLTGSQPGSATTDPNGNFAFLSLAEGGNYTVSPSLTFYSFTPASQTFNDLGANQIANFTGIRFTYSISGRVTEGVAAIGGVTIALSGAQSGSTLTDAAGNYSFAGLLAGGNYNLAASAPYYAFTPAVWTVVSLNGNQTANFAATRLTYQVSGVVQDACTRLIAGVTMTLSHDGVSAAATTNSSGQYSFSGVQAGYSYSLVPAKTGYTFSPSSAAFANLNANQSTNFTATPAIASTDVPPTADAYVRGGSSANANFGTATQLITRLASSATNTFETYLTFDVGQPCTVSSVKVKLFGNLSRTPNNVQVSAYAVSNTAWTENGLTWNNKPAAGALLRTTTVVNTTSAWYEWDITAYVQSELAAGRHIVSIVLKNPSTTSNQVTFNSREAATNRASVVVVTP